MNKDIQTLLSELAHTWHQTIPVSRFMQLQPVDASNGVLSVSAPLEPNINLHQSMFAGSIYTLCTLTGWGAVWLAQQLGNVEGDIILGRANIRYLAPITCTPVAAVRFDNINIGKLRRGQKLKQELQVSVNCEGIRCAQFRGIYVSHPIIAI
ncbi:MAG: thioesterase domain-containing protein [Shewanella sp.]|nr:thioesterase domain-containing protein [Shewanella sp.]MCF1430908.1 thioesterase domain-containing protein [Shewanella sp.]MCF1438235.1 thioesterase domain-containing protein [Shewanella sp.]MCF1457572.1 thioesterase domain-containing protein [Shewanella sp.]